MLQDGAVGLVDGGAIADAIQDRIVYKLHFTKIFGVSVSESEADKNNPGCSIQSGLLG